MLNDRLKVIQEKHTQPAASRKKSGTRHTQREEIQEKMEKAWEQNSGQFNPDSNCIERSRIERTMHAIASALDVRNKRIADIGCGTGTISKLLSKAGSGPIDAVDVAECALNRLKEKNDGNITLIQDCFPMTRLNDDFYDIVICTEVIGFLPASIYKLGFIELSRILKNSGHLIFSTELDLHSDEALEQLQAMAEGEFTIQKWVFFHHSSYNKLCRFFEFPQKKCDAKFLKWVWKTIALCFNPIAQFLRQSDQVMNALEKLTKVIRPHAGISHVLFIGQRHDIGYKIEKQMGNDFKNTGEKLKA